MKKLLIDLYLNNFCIFITPLADDYGGYVYGVDDDDDFAIHTTNCLAFLLSWFSAQYFFLLHGFPT